MIYPQNRQNVFHTIKSRAIGQHSEAVLPTSFAEKYRKLSIRTIVLLAGCLLLFAFCAVAVMQLTIQLETEQLLTGAKAVCQVVTKGSASSALSIPGSGN